MDAGTLHWLNPLPGKLCAKSVSLSRPFKDYFLFPQNNCVSSNWKIFFNSPTPSFLSDSSLFIPLLLSTSFILGDSETSFVLMISTNSTAEFFRLMDGFSQFLSPLCPSSVCHRRLLGPLIHSRRRSRKWRTKIRQSSPEDHDRQLSSTVPIQLQSFPSSQHCLLPICDLSC